MKEPIPFSPDNDLTLDLGKFWDYNQATGEKTEVTAGVIRVIIVQDKSANNPAHVSFDVNAVYGSLTRRWTAHFDASVLTKAVCQPLFGPNPQAWLVCIRANARRKVREMKYEEVSYAE